MTATFKTWGALCLSAQLVGCAGNGDGLDANGRPISSGGSDGVLTADFASIQANVLTPICTQCHVGANAPQGLRLDAPNSYGALVGVASSEQPGLLRVKPGDADASYLIRKLEGTADVGARMPLGQPALPNATILVIREWIASGADREAAASTETLAVQTVSVSAREVAVAMTQPVDASLVNATTVSLHRLASASGETATVHARTAVSSVNDSLIVLTPTEPLADGQYQLTLRGTGAAALAAWSAAVIDGDGDGVPGGDYIQAVTVEGAP